MSLGGSVKSSAAVSDAFLEQCDTSHTVSARCMSHAECHRSSRTCRIAKPFNFLPNGPGARFEAQTLTFAVRPWHCHDKQLRALPAWHHCRLCHYFQRSSPAMKQRRLYLNRLRPCSPLCLRLHRLRLALSAALVSYWVQVMRSRHKTLLHLPAEQQDDESIEQLSVAIALSTPACSFPSQRLAPVPAPLKRAASPRIPQGRGKERMER